MLGRRGLYAYPAVGLPPRTLNPSPSPSPVILSNSAAPLLGTINGTESAKFPERFLYPSLAIPRGANAEASANVD